MKREDVKHEDPRGRFSCFTSSRFTLLLLAILQFSLFLNHRDITTSHEGRVASTAREMLADHDWIVPHSNGLPRVVKPPLPYWAVAVTWKIVGSIDGWSARLPGALLGAIAVLLVMDLGRRVLGREGGIVAGLVWISTWFIIDEYRKAMADPYLAFFTLLSVWAWVAAPPAPTPRQSALPPRTVLILLFYISAGIAAMAKGHLILIHLPLAIVPYQLFRRRAPGRPVVHVIGIVLMLLIALPWFVYVLKHVPDTMHEWQEDAAAANATVGPKQSPWFHYLANLPLTAAPWTVLLIVGLLMPWLGRRRRERRHAWVVVWLLLTVLVFSLVPMKKNTYLLPAMPAQTLIIAAPIVAALRSRRQTAGDRFLFCAHAVAAAAAVCVMLGLVLSTDRIDMERPGPLLAAAGVGIFLLIGAKSLSPHLVSVRTFALTALGFALAVHGAEAWLIPDADNRRSDANFALTVNSNAADGAPLYLIGDGLREDVLFYLARTVPVIPSPDRLPADYKGYAIVTADQYAAVGRLDRADEIGQSADRPAKERLHLMRFPKDPNFQQRQRER